MRFLAGTAVGIGLALGYVHFGVALPAVMLLPETLRANLVSTAVESQIFDLSAPADVRRRALEIYIQSRPAHTAAVDAEMGHPLLAALQRRRAMIEARQMLTAYHGFDAVLAQPALRETLERRHATRDVSALRQAMLVEQVAKMPFLSQWLARAGGSPAALHERLVALARAPSLQ